MPIPARPGGSPMILRSACDGSCRQTYQRENSTRNRSYHRHHNHKHNHHHHHHLHEIHHVQYDNVILGQSKQSTYLDSTKAVEDFASSLQRESTANAAISAPLESNSISGLHFSLHNRFTGQTDYTVASGLENHLVTESRLDSKVSEYSAQQDEMSRSVPYVRVANANGSRVQHDTRSSRRLIGLEDTSDSEWSDARVTASRSVSTLFSQTFDHSLDTTCSGQRSGSVAWSWLYFWKTLYVIVSKVILFDTWILSRNWIQRLRRHWVLMVLGVPLIIFLAWAAVERPDVSDLPKPSLPSFFEWQGEQPPLGGDNSQVPRDFPPRREVPAADVQPVVVASDDVVQEVVQRLKVEFQEMNSRYDGVRKVLEGLQFQLGNLQESLLGIKKCCRSDAEMAALVFTSLNKVGESSGENLSGLSGWISRQIAGSSVWAEAHERIVRDARAAAASVAADAKSPAVNCAGCADAEILRKMIRDALFTYDADKTGIADYALESAGGSVVSTRCSETYNVRTALVHLFGIPLWYLHNSARTAIQPGTNPGDCWAFKGTEGRLVIQLATAIVPTAFSLEHIPRSLSLDGSGDTAPKDFSVWGLLKESDAEGTFLGSYTYDRDGEPLQRFAVRTDQTGPFHLVELRIHSNHGRIEYTCLYRFRVHGVPVQQSKP